MCTGAMVKVESSGPVRAQRKVLRVCPAKRPPAAPLSRAPARHRQAVRLPPDGTLFLCYFYNYDSRLAN